MVTSPRQSTEKVQTSREISSILTASTMTASTILETSSSVVYTEGPEVTREAPESSRMLAGAFTITNMEFTPELTYSSSENFKELARDLEYLLNDVFDEIYGFLYVKITRFEKGSIVCNFNIHTKVESSATADEFKKVLAAAANSGKTGKYQITNIIMEVHEQDDVEAVKGKKPEDKFPLKVIGVAAFGGVVALIIVFLVYKVSICK